MEEDTRLFSSNNPIGRFWYFFNIVLLIMLTGATRVFILDSVLPNASRSFDIAINCILYCAYFIYTITFLMLIDRRLCHICSSRDNDVYNVISKFIGALVLFIFIFAVISSVIYLSGNSVPPVLYDILTLGVSIIIVFSVVIGFLPGKLIKNK